MAKTLIIIAFMTVTEILQLADELVFAKKGKHLDELQESIIKGVWEDQTYQEIADQCNRSESRVRNVASQLLKLLSQKLGENIDKDNFRSTFKRLNISLSPHIYNVCNSVNNHSNFVAQILYPSHTDNQKNTNNNQSKSIYHDFKLAPKNIRFCDRSQDLTKLDSAIAQQTPLISVLGLSGIGKSYLVRKFVDLNLEKFEVIIWKNMKLYKSLNEMITEILIKTSEPKTSEVLKTSEVSQFFDLITKKKCLIILDDVQNIFMSGQFAGQYKTEYKDYQKFFTMITETEHQSNIILISQEKCAEMNCLDQQLYPIKSLELLGLNDINILDNTGLNNQDSWLKLIQLYEGNPTYLKDIIPF